MDDLTDLIGFLSHANLQVRQHAVDLVQGLTGSPEGISQLASRCDTLLPLLLRLACAESAVARPALVSLVNLSQEPDAQKKLLELNAPSRCMDYLKEKTSSGNEDLLVMLLANLTADEEGAAALLQIGKGALEGLNLAILLQSFLTPATDKDTYEHVATILPNVTRFEAGRRVLMEPGRGTLRALASQLRSPSELRRRGCAGAIKNCCFSCEEDGTVEAVGDETEALTDMLSVLCCTSNDKDSTATATATTNSTSIGTATGQQDNIVRETLAEAVVCLAKVPASRKKLWEVHAPELLRKGYEYEEHRGVCEAMEATAEFFLQDGFGNDDDDAGEGGGGEGLEGGTETLSMNRGGLQVGGMIMGGMQTGSMVQEIVVEKIKSKSSGTNDVVETPGRIVQIEELD